MLQIFLLSILTLSQELDCEIYTAFDSCHGQRHEGDWCYWKAETFECIAGEPNDPDHICGEIGDAQTCQTDNRCGWEESKCQDIHDTEAPVIINTGGNTVATSAPNTVTETTASSVVVSTAASATSAVVTGTTSGTQAPTQDTSATTVPTITQTTGTANTGSGCAQISDNIQCETTYQCVWLETANVCSDNPYVGAEPDCEMYLDSDSCNGKMHEGKACYWDPQGQECDEASPNDPEHLCPTLSELECGNFGLCLWNGVQNICLGGDNAEPDCEGWLDSQSCNGKTHEGKTCYFDPQEGKCVESDPLDPDHLCPTFTTSETCPSICFWSSFLGCQSADEFEAPEGYPYYNNGGNTITGELDCEMYLSSEECSGQTHEGKICFWDAQSGECEEGAAGDLEHICGQHGEPTSCQGENGCMWDLEGKCLEHSTLLTSVNCAQLSVDTCNKAHQCLSSSSGCVNRYLSSPSSSSPSTAPVSGLWLAGFVLGNVLLGAACALVCRNCILRRKPSSSYVNLDILEEQMVV